MSGSDKKTDAQDEQTTTKPQGKCGCGCTTAVKK